MMMKMGRTSRPHTPPYAMWFSKRGVDSVNRLPNKYRLLGEVGEVWPGSCLSKWTLVRGSLRPLKRSTLTGGHSGGCK